MRRPAGCDRGFALLIVLWTLVLLSLITTQIVAAGRTETRLASNLRAAAQAEAAADGAVHEALFHLVGDAAAGWPADGAAHRLRQMRGVAEIRVLDEAGKVNPNRAPAELLAALLRNVGADSGTARTIAAAMVDWRFPNAQGQPYGARTPQYRAAGLDYGPPGAPVQSVAEVGLVLGITPALLTRLAPHLSVYNDSDPDPGLADAVVLQAIRDATGQSGPATARDRPAPTLVAIVATVVNDDGGRFIRRATARLTPAADGRPYQILGWERVEG